MALVAKIWNLELFPRDADSIPLRSIVIVSRCNFESNHMLVCYLFLFTHSLGKKRAWLPSRFFSQSVLANRVTGPTNPFPSMHYTFHLVEFISLLALLYIAVCRDMRELMNMPFSYRFTERITRPAS